MNVINFNEQRLEKFDWVKSYDDFLDKFKVTGSNKETL